VEDATNLINVEVGLMIVAALVAYVVFVLFFILGDYVRKKTVDFLEPEGDYVTWSSKHRDSIGVLLAMGFIATGYFLSGIFFSAHPDTIANIVRVTLIWGTIIVFSGLEYFKQRRIRRQGDDV